MPQYILSQEEYDHYKKCEEAADYYKGLAAGRQDDLQRYVAQVEKLLKRTQLNDEPTINDLPEGGGIERMRSRNGWLGRWVWMNGENSGYADTASEAISAVIADNEVD